MGSFCAVEWIEQINFLRLFACPHSESISKIPSEEFDRNYVVLGNYRNIDRSDHSSNLLYDFKIIKREKKIIISLNGDIILKMIMMMTMMMTMMTKKMMMRKRMIMNQNRDVVR